MAFKRNQPVYTDKRPVWEDQIRNPEELNLGEIYELWRGDGGEEELVDIIQVMDEPREDNKGRLYLPVFRFSYQGSRDETPEDNIYLHQLSVLPAVRYRNSETREELWWNGNHLKKHESSVYKEMAGKLTAEEEEAVRYAEQRAEKEWT